MQSETPTENTTDRQRWLIEAQALISRCVPDADPIRVHVAAHRIVDQLDMVWRGRQEADFTKWRGAFDKAMQEDVP